MCDNPGIGPLDYSVSPKLTPKCNDSCNNFKNIIASNNCIDRNLYDNFSSRNNNNMKTKNKNNNGNNINDFDNNKHDVINKDATSEECNF